MLKQAHFYHVCCGRTCATPTFLKGLERPVIFEKDDKKDDAEWDLLYAAARSIIGTSEHEFDHSIRHNVVLQALQKAYPDRGVKALPLACHRLAEGSPYVQWHSAENVGILRCSHFAIEMSDAPLNI